ncbi:adenylate cyclase type 9-like isoform X2 [Acanthaster planci]|uniref:Adenylate cyclase type 9 n=1 Tax=Acanthaster planci TaxID=133434 RepID=A0A8B7Y1F4_ACAPL|nr:adenylate cyclase type 9-like isoform X2 [Acanthaster planci]
MAGNASDIEVHFNPNADEMPVEVTLRRRSSENSRTKGRSLCPKLFERASGSWWNPKFDSGIIEEQFQSNSFSQIRRRFRYALCYILAACVVWLIYLPVRNTVGRQTDHLCLKDQEDSGQQAWIAFELAVACLLVLCVILLIFTISHHYKSHFQKVSGVLCLCLCGLTLVTFVSHSSAGTSSPMSSVATFAMCIETILMMYTLIPMPYLYTLIPMLMFSVAYELLYFLYVDPESSEHSITGEVVNKLFLHVCVHLMGTHVFFMTQVRSRNTFMKIGQAVMARHQHQVEKQLKETTIHSLMPDSIAHKLLEEKGERSDKIFRPFYMDLMEDVSILFADIAGFTRMSANKSADVLVGLLNNLFGRFDILCLEHKCEKICTLGDCYYCVSGCPEPRPDHAECCVDMGLSMIEAIKDFCQETGEKVNMRVGVHTGKVLCGIIGNRRYKFDVWSNDVTMANKMEASGIPGKVHVSAQTAEFLGDKYIMEESRGDRQAVFLGGKTYFITGLKEDPSSKPAQMDTDVETSADNAKEPLSRAESKEDEAGEKGEVAGSEAGHGSSPNGNQSSKPLLGESKTDSRQNSPVWKRSSPGARKPKALEAPSHVPGDAKGENGGLGSSRTLSVRDLLADGNPLNIPLHNNTQSNSDQNFVDCIKQEGATDYFHKPPISNLTLTFHSKSIEALYRAQFRQDSSKEPRNPETSRKNRRHSSETISTAKYNTVFDVVVSFVVYLLISIGCFLVFQTQVHWLIIFPIAGALQLVVLSAVLLQAFSKWRSNFYMALSGFFHHWWPRHILGAILISLPILAVYANFLCQPDYNIYTKQFFCFLIVVALLHFCNFVQLSSWMKTILAFMYAVIMLVLFNLNPCDQRQLPTVPVANNSLNDSDGPAGYAEIPDMTGCTFEAMAMEVIIDIFLLLILVLFLNREFEISYRLNFYGGVEAGQDKEQMQIEKEEAETLLHEIIPTFVTEQMGSTSKFSQNHENVAVIFCSIVNFIDFYEEAYQDGKECIRVLHELVSDFDNLLSMEDFKSVEKIKTIGPTYMAACGLHPPSAEDDGNPTKCLINMMEFAIEMIKQVKVFNDEVLSITSGAFKFIPRIGYNHGQLTSGVIGTTKLLYDIWGDTVNVASRMDSTGLAGHIQVTEHTKKALEPYYIFEHRGPVKVRGKGDMTTYLFKGKRDSPLLIGECNSVAASPNGPSSPSKEA